MLWFIICIVLMIFLGPDIGLICPILFIWHKVVFSSKTTLIINLVKILEVGVVSLMASHNT